MSFYIEKIIVTGSGKTDSIIELSNGVNIIDPPNQIQEKHILLNVSIICLVQNGSRLIFQQVINI